jgi:hypothetical protein
MEVGVVSVVKFKWVGGLKKLLDAVHRSSFWGRGGGWWGV